MADLNFGARNAFHHHGREQILEHTLKTPKQGRYGTKKSWGKVPVFGKPIKPVTRPSHTKGGSFQVRYSTIPAEVNLMLGALPVG